jgi:SAM-dependent methyltransferase
MFRTVAKIDNVSFSISEFESITRKWFEDPTVVSKRIHTISILQPLKPSKLFDSKDVRVFQAPKVDKHTVSETIHMQFSFPNHLYSEIISEFEYGEIRLFSRHLESVDKRYFYLRCGDEYHALYHIVFKDDFRLPWFHPKLKYYRYVFNPSTSQVRVDAILINETEDMASTCRVFENLLGTMNKWALNDMKGYKKRVEHDVIVPKKDFQELYFSLKEKYSFWIEQWPESTDPRKHIFEDIAIASFLICLWRSSNTYPTFTDVGCGNGFLCYVLMSEGYEGTGIDQSSRKVWDLYPEKVKSKLQALTIFPHEMRFTTDWLIGNHADELSGWMPLLASLSGPNTKFMVLPCCFFNLNGTKFIHNKPNFTQYQSYLEFVKNLIVECGFVVETEHLRIPSTKNVAFVGRKRVDESTDAYAAILERIRQIIDESGDFIPRISDREKTRIWHEKRNAKLQKFR